MKSVYQSLAEALLERREVIGDHGTRDRDAAVHMTRLQAVSAKIERLQAQLPPDADPRLRHFLERCSYDKALQWLQAQ